MNDIPSNKSNGNMAIFNTYNYVCKETFMSLYDDFTRNIPQET